MKIYNTYKAKSISYSGTRTAKDIKFIVLHFTANVTDKAINNAKYFATSNTRKAGAHYFVDENDIYQSIDDLKVANAVGGSKYPNCDALGGGKKYGICTNKNSISIEMCSTNGQIAEKTINNAIELTKMLMEKYNISAKNVIRHWDVNGKPCPGWDGWIKKDESIWKKFLSDITAKKTSDKKTYSGDFPKETIKKGSTGNEVKKLQKFLNWYADFKLVVDGDCGTKTVSAIKTFQKNEGLTVDGIFGAKSLAKAKTIKR